MNVKVAGYNIDADILGRFKDALRELSFRAGEEDFEIPREVASFWDSDNLTPETISAAYARISRYPESVGELRRIAARSVARARKSNQTIVYEYGHASVAEHAVFNIDITGISRLAVETVESRRLMSYTEKSQRYIALAQEYIIPEELTNTVFEAKLISLCEESFKKYLEFLKEIEQSAANGDDNSDAKYLAREDARYLLPLAAGAQLGMTGNARNIEHLLRRTVNHPLSELREFAVQLKNQVEKIAPSLVRHLDEGQFDPEFLPERFTGDVPESDVELVDFDENADLKTLASLIFSAEGTGWHEAMTKSAAMSATEKMQYIRTKLQTLKSYHSLPRAYEAVDFAFQVSLSSSSYAQLKRHRLALQIPQPYDVRLGYTIPQTVIDCGLKDKFTDRVTEAERVYTGIFEDFPYLAPYALTNAHRRVVYFKANARELHHLARLRMDKHAQWDIRNVVTKMLKAAREKAPMTLALACGKDNFDDVFKTFLA